MGIKNYLINSTAAAKRSVASVLAVSSIINTLLVCALPLLALHPQQRISKAVFSCGLRSTAALKNCVAAVLAASRITYTFIICAPRLLVLLCRNELLRPFLWSAGGILPERSEALFKLKLGALKFPIMLSFTDEPNS